MSTPDSTQHSLATGIVAELEADGYHDAEPVGRGGFGVVYRCREPSLDRVVAIKVLSSDQDDVDLEHFDREQRAMGRVSGHPNIVPVLHSGQTFTGRPYIVMPYLSRNTLDAWIKGHGPLAVNEALTVGVRLAGALETAHRAGVLHRDVKPPNVLLTAYGEPQLCDFGIARIAGGRETAANILVGSPSYTAPELFEGRAPSVTADVYSLAATVFTLLNGGPPYQYQSGENPIAFVRRVMAGPIPDLRGKGVPDPVCSAVELGLNLDPAFRPGSAAAFGEILRAAGAQVGLTIAEVPLELPAPPTDADESYADSRHPRVGSGWAFTSARIAVGHVGLDPASELPAEPTDTISTADIQSSDGAQATNPRPPRLRAEAKAGSHSRTRRLRQDCPGRPVG